MIFLKDFQFSLFLMSVSSLENKKTLDFLFVTRTCLKSISSVKTEKITTPFQRKNNIIFMLFLNIYTSLGYIICITHINWIHKVWVDLINEGQQETHSLFGKKSKLHGINLLRGATSASQKLKLLESLDLCCSVLQLIPLDCGSIVVV